MTRQFETTTVHGTLYDYPKYYDLVFGEGAGLECSNLSAVLSGLRPNAVVTFLLQSK